MLLLQPSRRMAAAFRQGAMLVLAIFPLLSGAFAPPVSLGGIQVAPPLLSSRIGRMGTSPRREKSGRILAIQMSWLDRFAIEVHFPALPIRSHVLDVWSWDTPGGRLSTVRKTAVDVDWCWYERLTRGANSRDAACAVRPRPCIATPCTAGGRCRRKRGGTTESPRPRPWRFRRRRPRPSSLLRYLLST